MIRCDFDGLYEIAISLNIAEFCPHKAIRCFCALYSMLKLLGTLIAYSYMYFLPLIVRGVKGIQL